MIKVALIIDGNSISRWQREALQIASDLLEIKVILACQNTRVKNNYFKHFFYYVLNYFTLKNYLTRRVNFNFPSKKIIKFESIYEGGWQSLPEFVYDELNISDVDVVVKFGMNLLRIDDKTRSLRVLSYHHGDPSKFRGRPAGFYELLIGERSIGTVVQEITNKLDAGKVWAICHSKVYHHSYKKTAINFYSNSKFLLRKALLNIVKNTPINISSDGGNYKLPSNFLVVRFCTLLFLRSLMRLIYGAFYEKRWNIAVFTDQDMHRGGVLDLTHARVASVKSGYSFYADPFFSNSGEVIRLEAMSSINGLGEILEIGADTLIDEKVLLRGKHYSYPYSFSSNSEEYLLPEVASHSPPFILRSLEGKLIEEPLRGLESFRIVDGTIFELNGITYLFCGLGSTASDCLLLFFSEGINKKFEPHPLSPIVIDPLRARMGGRIIFQSGKIFRFGQNNSNGYGDGITVCEITKISKTDYEEVVVGGLTFNDSHGPHTVDVIGQRSVVDFYINKFSLFAWYRRTVPILLRRFWVIVP